jgi:EmrB/QacA subfamily drug resistance transporter
MTAVAVAAAMFMSQLDATVIHTAIPAMAASFDVAPLDLSIGVTIYLLAQAVCLPASAWLADRLGAKRIFAASVIGFTGASLLCGLTVTLEQFVAARVLQGACAALMMPVGGALLVRTVGKEGLVRVITLTSTAVLTAPTFGPAIGGFCVTYLSWPWAFFINIPVGIVASLLIFRFVPAVAPENPRPFDPLGFVLAAWMMIGLIVGLDRISAPGTDWRIATALVVSGIGAGVLFVHHATRRPHPILSLEPLRSEIYRRAVIGAGALIRIAIRALPFVLPLMFQLALGMSAFAAGLMLVMLNGADLVLKPLVRRMLQRFGYRANLIATCLGCALGTALCAAFVPGTPIWMILANLALLGGARSILFSGVQTLLYTDVPDEQTGSATVLWNVFQQLTSAVGVSLSAVLLNVLASLHGRWGGVPNLFDFRLLLLFHALLLLIAAFGFRRLQKDAGARLSGHSQS